MTDRELLEKAAKAAGINGWWEQEYLSFIKRDGGPWRPLDDDGDALRLAVKLDIGVCTWRKKGVVTASLPAQGNFIDGRFEPLGADEMAATRRAIVRAAAAVGEGK